MAPAAQRGRDDNSFASKPSFGPQNPTLVLRVFEIMVGVIFSTTPLESCRGLVGLRGDPCGISGEALSGGGMP